MPWPDHIAELISPETHFDDRMVKCFRDRPANLDVMFRNSVKLNGHKEALVADEKRLTYCDLNKLIDQMANGLLKHGVKQGDRAALLVGNRWEFLVSVLAIIRIGAIVVPINIREQTPELTFILNHCGAKILIYDRFVSERLPEASVLSDLRLMFCTDGAEKDAENFNSVFIDSSEKKPEVLCGEEDLAVILYTSGTTGLPKGAMLTHLNIIHSVMHFALCMEMGEKERSLVAVPASHVTGLVANLFTMIFVGGCNVMLRVFEAKTFLELAAREHITHTVIVPAMYNLCLLRADFEEYNLSNWRLGGFGGAPMPEKTIFTLAEKLPQLMLINAYGSTEASSPATMMPLGLGHAHADSVGICLPCGDIRIVDETGNDVPDDIHGEIWIGGPMVVPGYWQNEEKTLESFEAGYWKSGDIGSRDEMGFIRLHDRKKDMIIRGGYNIYSAEIENVLSALEAVIECAAIGQPDPVLGEKMHVFIFREDLALKEEDVKGFCAQNLADYKIPDFVSFIDYPLPRNANGKILKNTLREKL